jgi:small GTP-binding protein
MGDAFIKDYLSTLGADFSVKKLSLGDKDGTEMLVELQIWDIAGQEGFASLRARFFQGASAAFLVFDVNTPSTFEELGNWLNQLWAVQDKHNIPLIFIGNKSDLDKPPYKVSEHHVIEFIKKLRIEHELDDVDIRYIFTSALTGENILDTFDIIANIIYERWVKISKKAP